MPWIAPGAVRHALRLSRQQPIRLALLVLTLLLCILAFAWNQVATARLLREQAELLRFMGESAWVVELRQDEASPFGTRLAPRLSLGSSQVMKDGFDAGRPMIALTQISAMVRQPKDADAQSVPLAVASPATGLIARQADGSVPCVWLGQAPAPGPVWWVGRWLSCQVQPMPRAWHAVHMDLDSGPLLVVPESAAPLALPDPWWHRIHRLYLASAEGCSVLQRQDPALACRPVSMYASQSVQTAAALGRWQQFMLPAGLLGVLLASLFYFRGQRGALERLYALSVATGLPRPQALRKMRHIVQLQAWCICGVLAATGLLLQQGTGLQLAILDLASFATVVTLLAPVQALWLSWQLSRNTPAVMARIVCAA